MHPIKTDKARAELALPRGALDRRARNLLLLADGRRDASTLVSLVMGAEKQLLLDLQAQGYLKGVNSPAASVVSPTQRVARPAPAPAVPAPSIDTPQEASRFLKGTAATKMFLLDLNERCFAASAPEARQRLREQLRGAGNEQALSEAAEALLEALAAHAGVDRAEAVRAQVFALEAA